VFNVQCSMFCKRDPKIAGGRRPTQRERGMDGWMIRDEHSKHIDQYEARVLRCTHVERPSPGPEARLLTLMMVCSSGACVFSSLVSVVRMLMFRNWNEFDAKMSFFIDFVSQSRSLDFLSCVFDGFFKANVPYDL
jgi:hypothetical protein